MTTLDILSDTVDRMMDCGAHQEPELISIVLTIGSATLKNASTKEKGKLASGQKMLALTMLALERCNVYGQTESADDSVALKPLEAICLSGKKKAIPAFIFDSVLDSATSLPELCSNAKVEFETCVQILVLGAALKKSDLKTASAKAFEIYDPKENQLLLAKIAALKIPAQIFSTKSVQLTSGNLEKYFSQAQHHASNQVKKL